MQTTVSQETLDLMSWIKTFATTRINFRLQNRRRCVQPHVILEFGQQGVFGIQVPKKYNGLELTHTCTCKIIEQLGGIDLTLAALVGQNNMGIRPIVEFGSQSLQEELLPALAKGRMLSSFAITELDAGSDVANIRGTLKKISDTQYLLNAKKMWIGMGSWSGVSCVIVKHKCDDKVSNAMTACIVRAGTKGYTIGEECLTVGMRGAVQNCLHFKDVIICETDILGLPQQGLQVANNTMQLTRLGVAAMSIGAMKRCLLFALRYASRRQVNTGLLTDNPLTRIKVNHFIAKIKAVECLVYVTTKLLDAGVDVPIEIHIVAKVAGSEFLGEIADQTLQILGARGYTENNIFPYFFLDARALRIFEGPSEVLVHYCGSLMKLRQRRTSLFSLLQAEDLIVYLEEGNDILLQAKDKYKDFFEDGHMECTMRGWITCWIVLLAAVRLENKNSPFKEFSLTENWLLQKLKSTLHQMKSATLLENIISNADINTIVESFDAIDIEQYLPDEDTTFDTMFRK